MNSIGTQQEHRKTDTEQLVIFSCTKKQSENTHNIENLYNHFFSCN